jgi:hypothetical protein
MREIRQSGSEGGGAETNRPSLPLPPGHRYDAAIWIPAFVGRRPKKTG